MPSALPKSPIASLAEYIERIKQIQVFWRIDKERRYGEIQNIWFRGHASTHWNLTPKLYRNEFKGSNETEIRQEFQIRAQQLIQGGRFPADKWEWYFLMQHYGAPTRLLDWTDNPLVALYFALHDPHCDPAEPDGDVAVWVLNSWWLNRQLHNGIEGPMLPDWDEAQAYLPDLEDAFAGRVIRVHKTRRYRSAARRPPTRCARQPLCYIRNESELDEDQSRQIQTGYLAPSCEDHYRQTRNCGSAVGTGIVRHHAAVTFPRPASTVRRYMPKMSGQSVTQTR
jgi:hypothetical protein